MKLKIPILECNRCGYRWYPRAPDPPKNCANKECKSPYWNKPRVYTVTRRQKLAEKREK